MNLFDTIKAEMDNNIKNFYLNTGTIMDLVTGNSFPGNKNSNVINGGAYIITSIIGRAQTYKSAIALSYFSKILNIYKNIFGICYDTEFTIAGIERIEALNNDINKLSDRIYLCDQNKYNMAEFYDFLISLVNEKKQKEKKWLVETPFINSRTGQYYLSYLPTFVVIDSWTLMQGTQEQELYANEGIGNSKSNTAFMIDGKQKTQFLRQMSRLGASVGIYLIPTAHVGSKVKINPFEPTIKELQYMRAGDSIKGVGSQFTFLSPTVLETRKVKPLVDSGSKCLYPGEISNDVELQEVILSVYKGKNNNSGATFSHVVSQNFGIQEGLDWYNLLKNKDNYGLTGNNRNKACILKPDIVFNRKNIRNLLSENSQFKRAIEITGQLAFVQSYWALSKSIKKLTPEILFNEISKLKKTNIDEILNSRGYWIFNDQKDDKKYLSIFDIINLINR